MFSRYITSRQRRDGTLACPPYLRQAGKPATIAGSRVHSFITEYRENLFSQPLYACVCKLQFVRLLRIFSQMKTISNKKDLSYPVQYVKGIGPRRAQALAEQGVETVHDLLYYFPFDYIDLSKVEKIGNLERFADSDKWITTIGTVRSLDLIGRFPRQRFVITLGDETGIIKLIFFQSVNFFKKAFTEGELLAASGKITSFNDSPQMVHPSIDRLSDDEGTAAEPVGFLHTKGIVPKYGSSASLKDVNLNVKGFRRIIHSALNEYLDLIPEILPPDVLLSHRFLPIKDAIQNIHFPQSEEKLNEARKRLKFDEFFALQLMLAIHRTHVKVDSPGIAFEIKSNLARKTVDSLPFKLTKAQQRVVKEITADMASQRPMSRLLQGDVGSGKTIVSLLAMLVSVDNGYQAAFMAPTEILAEQHFRTLQSLLKDSSVNIQLLIGGQRSRLRKDTLEFIEQGKANIIVGTHALIQQGVKFSNLGLVIIDEQHRFGVAQRVSLRQKGIESQNGIRHPDILIMTATPIPRTLSLTVYGDLDVSVIDEMPASRRQIKTLMRTESEMATVYSFVHDQVKQGRQVYIVYPLVEESEKLDLKAATDSYERLKSELFTDLRVGLLHGKMKSALKDEVMQSFKEGEIDILVATTVVEVGIDVPNASVMIIEHVERYGLAQLHQLRGRVGRGTDQSYCLMIAPDWMKKNFKSKFNLPVIDGEADDRGKVVRRIETMLNTTDGFKIAEIDLELRGPGDFFGTRQSGMPLLRLANILIDHEILSLARTEAFRIVEDDPHLRKSEHQSVRNFFKERLNAKYKYLFGG
ncbi:MAG: ATP-dependent DNA helicase RecG [Ignavibacteriales bacterium]|nr:ATP-dependent DNA helicase RecG [Ignavibacteriales bacterium]